MAFERTRQAKSFGEPVRVRTDGTRTQGAKDDEPGKGARPGSAYEKYKQQLHGFFNGTTPLPDHLKDLLATRPGASEHMEGVPDAPAGPAGLTESDKKSKGKKAPGGRKADERPARRVVGGADPDIASLVEQIKRAVSPREVEGAIDALKAKGVSLPGDPEVLSKALGHSKEAVHEEALRGIKSALETGTMKPTTLLKTRIHNVALLASSSDVRDLCGDLKKMVG